MSEQVVFGFSGVDAGCFQPRLRLGKGLNATISKWLGVYSLGPIYVVTVLLLMKSCELPLSSASKIGGLYYAYHAVSVICLRLIFQRLA